MVRRFLLFVFLPLLAVTWLGVAAPVHAQPPRYKIINLGVLPGGEEEMSQAYALNNVGQIVGISATDKPGKHVGCLWQIGLKNITTLKSLPNGRDGSPSGINDNGLIVGSAGGATLHQIRGVAWDSSGNVRDLGLTRDGQNTAAISVNARGVIVGYGDYGYAQYPALYVNGLWTSMAGQFISVCKINRAGQVAGTATHHNGSTHALLWKIPGVFWGERLPGWHGEANDLNDQGFVVGRAFWDGETHAALWTPEGAIQDLGTLGGSWGEAVAINARGQIIGQSDTKTSPRQPFLYQDGVMYNLLTLVSAEDNADWGIMSQTFTPLAINDLGQIVGYGVYRGKTRGFVMVPEGIEQPLPPSTVTLLAANSADGAGNQAQYAVDGIVCDNLRGMDASLRNSLTLQLPAEFADATVTGEIHGSANGGSFAPGTSVGKITYFPPDEYNENPEPANASADITKPALRTVTLTLHLQKPDGTRFVVSKDIYLARPPVVLVHGINSTPDDWHDLMYNVQQAAGVSVPLVRVDHSDVMGGNGPVEVGAFRLAQTIHDPTTGILAAVRYGRPIHKSVIVFTPSEPPILMDFSDYTDVRLAIRRVDVVAWSYGGVITRWYLASDGSNPSHANSQAQSWYRRLYNYNTASALTTAYAGDIRKLITLGSMWRGVPFVNYANEVAFKSYPSPSGLWLGDGAFPSLFGVELSTLSGFINALDADALPIHLPVRVPSMEVMAVNSPWLTHLIFGNRTPGASANRARPFRDDTAYGSISGDNHRYLAGVYDSHHLAHTRQQPSWFPYLSLEYANDVTRNYNDGIVPVWSSAIPGSYKIAPSNHRDYVRDPDTLNYVIQWLNNAALPTGRSLNDVWNAPTAPLITSANGRKSWQLNAGSMAPYPQSDLYTQINGIGRVNGQAIGRPVITGKPAIPTFGTYLVSPLTRSGSEIVATVRIRNVGQVMSVGTQLTSATLTQGTKIGFASTKLPLQLRDGAATLLPKGSSDVITLRFPGTTGKAGASAILRVTVSSHFLNSSDTTTSLRVHLP